MPNSKNANLGGAGGRGGRGGYDPTTREREKEASGGRRDKRYGYFGGRESVIAGVSELSTVNRGGKYSSSPEDLESEQTTRGRKRSPSMVYEFDTEIIRPRPSGTSTFDQEFLRPRATRVSEYDTARARSRDYVERTRDYVERNRDFVDRNRDKEDGNRDHIGRTREHVSRPDARPGRELQDDVSLKPSRRDEKEGLYDFGGRQSVAVGTSPWASRQRSKGGKVDFSRYNQESRSKGEVALGPSRSYGDRFRSGTTRDDMRQGFNDRGSQKSLQIRDDDGGLYDFGGRQSIAVGASPFGAGIRRKSEMSAVSRTSSKSGRSISGADPWSPDGRTRIDAGADATPVRTRPVVGAETLPLRGRSAVGTDTRSSRLGRRQEGTNEEYIRHSSRREYSHHGLYDFGGRQSMSVRESRGTTGDRQKNEGLRSSKKQGDDVSNSGSAGSGRRGHGWRVRGTHTTGGGRNLHREASYEYYDLGGQETLLTRGRSQWGLNARRSQEQKVEPPRSTVQNVERRGEKGERYSTSTRKSENAGIKVGVTSGRGGGGGGLGKEGQPGKPHRRTENHTLVVNEQKLTDQNLLLPNIEKNP